MNALTTVTNPWNSSDKIAHFADRTVVLLSRVLAPG